MMINVKAFAKLNISLDVTGKMDDGYHSLRTVMQSADLCDNISINLRTDGRVSAASNLSYLPGDDKNIAVKAAKMFFELAGITGTGADIVIKKNIPVCSGLGGGSSDAAAVLRGLNELTGAELGAEELGKLGASLGSDVPFCIAGGTVLGTGRGDILETLPPLPQCHVVICKPSFSISTPELYSQLDRAKTKCRPDTDGVLERLGVGDLKGVAMRMYNVFEDVLPRQYGEIFNIKSILLDIGALGVTMTGTGSAVFGLFDDADAAQSAWKVLKEKYRESFLAMTTDRLEL